MKKIYIGTSWKMNKTLAEALLFCEQFRTFYPENLKSQIQPFVIPPFTCVREVSDYLLNNKINCLTGAQNMHFEDSGAFTGEISPIMVKDTGAKIVEIGHSERRANFGENDIAINKKVKAALKHGLTPLVCIGDSYEEKSLDVSAETVIKQMKIALFEIDKQHATQVIIAYEPIWAIGENGIAATPEEAQYIHHQLRSALVKLYGQQIAYQMILLYGGSVNLENSTLLIAQPDIDGLFIGRSAWQATGFCNILSAINQQN